MWRLVAAEAGSMCRSRPKGPTWELRQLKNKEILEFSLLARSRSPPAPRSDRRLSETPRFLSTWRHPPQCTPSCSPLLDVHLVSDDRSSPPTHVSDRRATEYR